MDRNPQFDAAVERLARVMAITQISMSTSPPAALFALNLPPLLSAIVDLADQLIEQQVPSNYQVLTESTVLGQATADLIAESISTPAPNTIPEDWT